MPKDNLRDLKPQYLEVIELVRAGLKSQLGKTGDVPLTLSDLKSIAPEHKINRYLRQLAQDKIIAPMPMISFAEIDVHAAVDGTEPEVVVHCLKTVEQIQEYRFSLQAEIGEVMKFPVSSWESLEIKFVTKQQVILAAHEASGVRRADATYAVLGFANKKDKKPTIAWEFLYLLSAHGGVISPTNVDLKSRNQLAKHKQELKEQMQIVFGLDTDPFHEYRTNRQYEAKFSVTRQD